jgi:tetraacyldisaccharide 4'-kinase
MLGPRLSLALRHAWRIRWHPLSIALLPLSWVFGLAAASRRAAYACGLFATHQPSAVTCVVGNVSAGGGGKTPLVIELCRRLREIGLRVGIITRGYGGQSQCWPLLLSESTRANEVGDEALVLRDACVAPIVAGSDRVASMTKLLSEYPHLEVVISDDGLQHYRLGRHFELIAEDATFAFGNGRLLPAGPLRESVSRFEDAKFVLQKNAAPDEPGYALEPKTWVQVGNDDAVCTLDAFDDKANAGKPIAALVGIAQPAGFLSLLDVLGYQYKAHIFPDHHHYCDADLLAYQGHLVLTTTKDAAKLQAFAADYDIWALQTKLAMTASGEQTMQLLVDAIARAVAGATHRQI